MSRIVLLNGDFVPFAEAKLSIMDRGFLFADGIYEVSAVLNRRTIDNAAHLARLDRSLKAIDIPNPYSMEQWAGFQKALIDRNALGEGLVYLQVTRGVAERDFAYDADLKPSVVMFTQVKSIRDSPLAAAGASVITVPDLRWARRDIKSIALLPQVLAKQAALRAGAQEAWMVGEDGLVTEGASSSAFILTHAGVLLTRPQSQAILPGITRLAVLALIAETGLALEERAFSVKEAQAATEAFFTSASALVMPVVRMNGAPVGTGKPGPMTMKLREIYLQMALARSGEFIASKPGARMGNGV